MLALPGAREEIRRLSRQLQDCNREVARLEQALQRSRSPIHRIALAAHRAARDATQTALHTWIGDLN